MARESNLSSEEHPDIHRLKRYFQNKLESIREDPDLSERNKEIILKYLRDSELGKTLRKGQKRTIEPGRNLQVAGYLGLMAREWFKCDLDKVTDKIMEDFVLGLDQGKIKNRKKGAYTSETKSNIKKFIRKFYKWLLTDNRYYPDLVEWIDTSKKEAEIQAIPHLKEGVLAIVERIPDYERKSLVFCTFDSGFRFGEILSCKLRDLEKREDGVYYLTCRYSKTKPRTVSLPYSSKMLETWLQEHPDAKNRNSDIWTNSRKMFTKTMDLYGRKAHGIHLTIHMLRHTSATFWASRLDRASFCKRFGWSYSSAMPDRYIDFAKVGESKVVDAVKAERVSQLAHELDEQKAQNTLLQQKLTEVQSEFANGRLSQEAQMKAMMEKFKEINKFMDKAVKEDPSLVQALAGKAK